MDFRTERDRLSAADVKGKLMAPGQPPRASSDDLEAKVAEAYERSHPDDTFGDLKTRARFSKEDRGLLKDWMAAFASEGD